METGKDVQMTMKWIGALLIIASCGGFGFRLVAAHMSEERNLRQLICILDYMSCELQYRLTPLPVLCRQAASECCGTLSEVLLQFATELDNQISPDVDHCMQAALASKRGLPPLTLEAMDLLGHSMGKFDISGQLLGLESIRKHCRDRLEALKEKRDIRLRGYQTLALCAGAALVILFI